MPSNAKLHPAIYVEVTLSWQYKGGDFYLYRRKPASSVPCAMSNASSSNAAKMYSISSCSVFTAKVLLRAVTCIDNLQGDVMPWKIP